MNAIAGMILMVVTSHAQLSPNETTGLWLEEFTVPYGAFVAAGYRVDVASPKGGEAPVDPRSLQPVDDEGTIPTVPDILKTTKPLASIDPGKYTAVFFPGGHGTMFDLPTNAVVQNVVNAFLNSARPTAFVCHGPAALVGATTEVGEPAVKGRKLTAFTNDEETTVELTDEMPFLLESRLKELGADFVGAENFAPHVVVDGNLVTGQNPASSKGAAEAVLKQLSTKNP